MRKVISIGVSLLAAAVLVVLSATFARVQNPTLGSVAEAATVEAAPAAAAAEPAPAPADSVAGRRVFEELGCLRCHSVAGEGNPRNPLDGVGARRTPEALRDWTVGAEVLADSLPPSAFRAKQAFQSAKPEELDALVSYLASLTRSSGGDR